MCGDVVSKECFMSKYCLGKYKAEEMCNKTVNAFLSKLKFVSDWFASNKMLEKLDNSKIANDDISLLDVDISLDDDNFDENDPETIIDVRVSTQQDGAMSACRKKKNK